MILDFPEKRAVLKDFEDKGVKFLTGICKVSIAPYDFFKLSFPHFVDDSNFPCFHRAAQEAKSEDSRGELSVKDLRRQYHCHAYNLMVAIISCVQTELKFYKGFLFQDNIAKVFFLIIFFILFVFQLVLQV